MVTYDCPICHKLLTVNDKRDAPFRPFCSKRCKMVDLGRWLDGTYAISEELGETENESRATRAENPGISEIEDDQA